MSFTAQIKDTPNFLKPLVSNPFPNSQFTKERITENALIDEVLASKVYRHGKRPNDASIEKMKQVVCHHIKNNEPIPFLVPWGSRKPEFNRSIDVSELATLKTMVCLNARIKKHYSPGAKFYIRVEDASGHFIHRRFGEKAFQSIKKYGSDLANLVRIMGVDDFIIIANEMQWFSPQEFTEKTENVTPIFVKHIEGVRNGLFDNYADPEMSKIGWSGVINRQMQTYYLDRYYKMYPEIEPDVYDQMMAEYFAGAITRRQLLAGFMDSIGPVLTLSFVPPIPGLPSNLTETRVYYRTVPSSMTSHHMPCWRSKGYVQKDGDSAVFKIASWKSPNEYERCSVTLMDSLGNSVVVDSDILS